jgi:hypothetical protein
MNNQKKWHSFKLKKVNRVVDDCITPGLVFCWFDSEKNKL